MSIVKMKRIALVGLDVKKADLLSELMSFGALEITDQSAKSAEEIWKNRTVSDENQEIVSEIEAKISRAQMALDVIDKYGVVSVTSPSLKEAV